MWREILSSHSENFRFHPSVSAEEMNSLEEALSTIIADDLRSFLMETNGVEYPMAFPDYEPSYFSGIWSTDEIVDTNLSYKEGNCSNTQYLLFTELLNGDMVGYAVDDYWVCENRIFAISHDSTDEPYEIATSLREFIGIIGDLAKE